MTQLYPFLRKVPQIRGVFLCLFIGFYFQQGLADDEITTIRENLAKALEYEDQAAREHSDWRNQREEMESLIILAQEEERALINRLSASRAALHALAETKETLLEKKQSHDEILTLLRDRLEPIKEEINRQSQHWPLILQQDTMSDMVVLNNSPLEDLSVGTRKALGAALDIIKTAGDFQKKINQGYLVKELPDGNEAMFQVIFLGLAQGYYFSEDLGLAGSITFDANQWVWKDNRRLLPALESFSDFLRGNQQAALVELPLELRTDLQGGKE